MQYLQNSITRLEFRIKKVNDHLVRLQQKIRDLNSDLLKYSKSRGHMIANQTHLEERINRHAAQLEPLDLEEKQMKELRTNIVMVSSLDDVKTDSIDHLGMGLNITGRSTYGAQGALISSLMHHALRVVRVGGFINLHYKPSLRMRHHRLFVDTARESGIEIEIKPQDTLGESYVYRILSKPSPETSEAMKRENLGIGAQAPPAAAVDMVSGFNQKN
jgi:hypothetical protein